MKVGEAIADALATEADGPIFGLMGDANMSAWSALNASGRARMVWSRHDGAAILMADGYAAATGRLAVATVTCGPGLANCANAILSASRARTPMVIYTGEYRADGTKSSLQALDQRLFARACEAEFCSLERTETLAEEIAEAFYLARTRHCPVILNLPHALWDADFKWDWQYRPSRDFVPPQDVAPPAAAVELLADKLVAARRPVIVAGRGAIFADARKEIERLGDRLGALFATSLLAKGFFDGHPYDVGVSGSYSSAVTEKLLAQADLVLGIGASLNFYTTEGGLLYPAAEIVRVDVRQFAPAIGFTPGMYLQGDAKATAVALLRALDARRVQENEGFRTAATREALGEKLPPPPRATDGLDPRELMRELSRALPPESQVIVSAGHFSAWPCLYLALPREARFHRTSAFGSIGLGLPVAIGAAVGSPQGKTLLIEGDGGMLQSIQELHAAADQRIPLVVLVMNDGAYGAEVHKLQHKKLSTRDVQWNSPDFVAVARGFGGDGVRIEREADLAPAIEQGMAFPGPFVIDARISPSTVSDLFARIRLGQPNQVPLLRPSV